MKNILFGLILSLGLLAAPVYALSTEQIKQQIIKESISSYPGNCPCPYNKDRAGRNCGRRSAYNRAGGYSPVCYPNDITPAMIKEFNSRK